VRHFACRPERGGWRAREREIEITPEMIEAGITAYVRFEDADNPEKVEMFTEIFLEMARAARRPICHSA